MQQHRMMISLRGILSWRKPFRGPTTFLQGSEVFEYSCRVQKCLNIVAGFRVQEDSRVQKGFVKVVRFMCRHRQQYRLISLSGILSLQGSGFQQSVRRVAGAFQDTSVGRIHSCPCPSAAAPVLSN
jgi:hypothetical protein